MFDYKNKAYWLFVSPIWLVPIIIFFLLKMPDLLNVPFGSYYVVYFLVFSAFIRLPHFLSTYMLMHQKNTFNYLMERKIKYIFIPLLLFLSVLYSYRLGSDSRRVVTALVTTFGFSHICFQAMGITLLIDKLQIKTVNLIKIFYLSLFFLNLLIFKLPRVRVNIDINYIYAFEAAVILLFLYLCFLLKNSLSTLFYLITTSIFLFPMSYFTSEKFYFLFYDFHHSLNYIALTFFLFRNKESNSYHFKKYFLLIVFSFVLLVFFSAHGGFSFLVKNKGEWFFLGFFTLHYYFDTIIWRDRTLNFKSELRVKPI